MGETGAVIVLPLFEKDGGVFYAAAAVIDAEGRYLGKYTRCTSPTAPTLWKSSNVRTGNFGCPVFDTAYVRIGVNIRYDRHLPEVARLLDLTGAEIVFIPKAAGTVSKRMWMIESRGHALANGYFVGSLNRVGRELNPEVEFFEFSYFCDPRGEVLAQGSETEEEVVTADLDLAHLRPRGFYFRDRRSDLYGPLITACAGRES